MRFYTVFFSFFFFVGSWLLLLLLLFRITPSQVKQRPNAQLIIQLWTFPKPNDLRQANLWSVDDNEWRI